MSGKALLNLFGVIIDSKPSFQEHVSKLCQKVSIKVHALAPIDSYMRNNKRTNNYESFYCDSQFGYCSIIWMIRSGKLNKKINRLQEKVLKMVYK